MASSSVTDVIMTYPEKFHAACAFADKRFGNLEVNAELENGAKLALYALRQQAEVGPCNTPAPYMWNVTEKYKHSAWSHLGKMSQFEAMVKYVQIIEELAGKEWAVDTASSPMRGDGGEEGSTGQKQREEELQYCGSDDDPASKKHVEVALFSPTPNKYPAKKGEEEEEEEEGSASERSVLLPSDLYYDGSKVDHRTADTQQQQQQHQNQLIQRLQNEIVRLRDIISKLKGARKSGGQDEEVRASHNDVNFLLPPTYFVHQPRKQICSGGPCASNSSTSRLPLPLPVPPPAVPPSSRYHAALMEYQKQIVEQQHKQRQSLQGKQPTRDAADADVTYRDLKLPFTISSSGVVIVTSSAALYPTQPQPQQLLHVSDDFAAKKERHASAANQTNYSSAIENGGPPASCVNDCHARIAAADENTNKALGVDSIGVERCDVSVAAGGKSQPSLDSSSLKPPRAASAVATPPPQQRQRTWMEWLGLS